MINTTKLADRARLLRLSARSLSEEMRTGGLKSAFKGQGIEFEEVREYAFGDDIRLIDWNITARMNRSYVKRYREERELTLFLVIDTSLSMTTGTEHISRCDQAWECAALLLFAAEISNNSLGAVIFDGDNRHLFVPRLGRDYVMTILNKLEQYKSVSPGSDLDGALKAAATCLHRRSLLVVLSDFRTTGYYHTLGVLAKKHDVIAIRITDPSDFALPQAGLLSFVDPETGVRAYLPTSSNSFKQKWKTKFSESILAWRQQCRRVGVVPLVVSTTDDSAKSLIRFFSGGMK